MNLDLFKYIMKLSVIPIMLISLLLITHGTDDNISVVNVIGFVLLIISFTIIITNVKNEDE